MTILLLIFGLVLFILLIVTHELGHFWLARRSGVQIEEFGLFFPPGTLYRRKMKGGWNFTINLWPLGGFVKLKGEHDADTARGSFGAASLLAKSKIMLAGIVVNLISAFLLFTGLALVGMPHLVSNQFTVPSDTTYEHIAHYQTPVDSVESGSPAAQAGLKKGDTILAVGPQGRLQTLSATNNLSAVTKRYQGQLVEVRYKAGGKTYETSVKLRSNAEVAAAAKRHQTIGRLGVSSDPFQDGVTVARSTWSAPVVAAGTMGQLTGLTFEGLGKALAGLGGIIAGSVTHNTLARQNGQAQASSQVSGPVGIFFVFKYGAALGVKFILMIVAVLALTLGIMNLLPIPALDGGRLWMTLIAHALKKPLSARREEAITATGFAVLMMLIVLVTIADVKNFL